MNHCSLNSNESVSLLATRQTESCAALFEVMLAPVQTVYHIPSQISVDPNVWGFKSTTCFLRALPRRYPARAKDTEGRRHGRCIEGCSWIDFSLPHSSKAGARRKREFTTNLFWVFNLFWGLVREASRTLAVWSYELWQLYTRLKPE